MKDRGMASTEEDTTANLTALSTTLETSSSKLDITREELEKRQLLHRIELLKLELSQQTMLIDTLRKEQSSQVEELQEQLADVYHQRKMLHLKLKSSTHLHEQEVMHLKQMVRDLEQRRDEERRRREEDEVEERRRREEGECEVGGWEGVRETVKSALHLPPLTEKEYISLRGRERGEERVEGHTQSLTDYIRVRLYESMEPIEQEKARLQDTVERLSASLTEKERELTNSRENAATLASRVAASEDRCEQLLTQLSQLRARLQDGNFKIATFDQLASERDALKSEVEGLRGTVARLNNLQTTTQERDTSQREVSLLQQKVSLLLQDKEYLSQQASELGGRAVAAEGREEALTRKLAESQAARDSLYQEFIQIREKERREGEEKLQKELERLRQQSRQELEHTTSYTKELFDRENRTLMESYHRLSEERDRAITGERETGRRYELLLQDHQKLQSKMESRISELQATVQVKTFEVQQAQAGRESTSKQLKEARLLADTLQKKVELLGEEVGRVRSESGERVRELEGRAREVEERLAIYQKVETEIDDVVLQAAQAESESDAEKILFSYGFGAQLPTTARRRAQQSVRLAQRVLQLERVNSALRRDSEVERARSKKLQEECDEQRRLLSQTGQPQSYIVGSLRAVQNEARDLRDRLASLQKKLESVQEENKRLKEINKQMKFDIETLLRHRQELSAMKQLLLSAQGEADCPHHLRLAPLHPTSLHPTSLHPSSLHPSSLHPPVNPENDSFTPRPVLFTKGGSPCGQGKSKKS